MPSPQASVKPERASKPPVGEERTGESESKSTSASPQPRAERQPRSAPVERPDKPVSEETQTPPAAVDQELVGPPVDAADSALDTDGSQSRRRRGRRGGRRRRRHDETGAALDEAQTATAGVESDATTPAYAAPSTSDKPTSPVANEPTASASPADANRPSPTATSSGFVPRDAVAPTDERTAAPAATPNHVASTTPSFRLPTLPPIPGSPEASSSPMQAERPAAPVPHHADASGPADIDRTVTQPARHEPPHATPAATGSAASTVPPADATTARPGPAPVTGTATASAATPAAPAATHVPVPVRVEERPFIPAAVDSAAAAAIQPPATHDVIHTMQPEQGDLLAAARGRNAVPPTAPAAPAKGDDAATS
jgi:ribonuclease E